MDITPVLQYSSFIAKLSFAICLQTGEGSRLLLHSSRVLRNSLGDILVSIQAHQHHLALTCIIHLSGHLDQHNIIRQLVSPGFTQNQMIESKLYLTLIRIARSEGPQAIRLGRTIVVILDRISINWCSYCSHCSTNECQKCQN